MSDSKSIRPVSAFSLADRFKALTTKRIERTVVTTEKGVQETNREVEEVPILDQVAIQTSDMLNKNGSWNELLDLSLAVPTLGLALPDREKITRVGSGSAVALGEGVYYTANHVGAGGIGASRLNPWECIPGSKLDKDIREYTRDKGAELYLDFACPGAPKTFLTGDSSKGKAEDQNQIISVPVVILDDDPTKDVAVLGLKNPNQKIKLPFQRQNGALPFLTISPDKPNFGQRCIKLGHAGSSDPLLASQGEVLIPRVSEDHLRSLEDLVDRATRGVKNILGFKNGNSGDGPSAADIMTLFSHYNKQDIMRFFNGNVLTSALAEGGDSGGVLIDPQTGEVIGTTILGLIPFLNNRFVAGAIAGFGLKAQGSELPIEHLSLGVGTDKILDHLDTVLGRKNVYRIIDGKGAERVTPEEARRNRARQEGIKHFILAAQAEGIPERQIARVLKRRNNIEVPQPLSIERLQEICRSRREQQAQKDGASTRKVSKAERGKEKKESEITYHLGSYRFKSMPTKILKLDSDLSGDSRAVIVSGVFKTLKGKETISGVRIDPTKVWEEMSSTTKELTVVDTHTAGLIKEYYDNDLLGGFRMQNLAREVQKEKERREERTIANAGTKKEIHPALEGYIEEESPPTVKFKRSSRRSNRIRLINESSLHNLKFSDEAARIHEMTVKAIGGKDGPKSAVVKIGLLKLDDRIVFTKGLEIGSKKVNIMEAVCRIQDDHTRKLWLDYLDTPEGRKVLAEIERIVFRPKESA